MAIVIPGAAGKFVGKTAETVFSSARAKTGKVVTARSFVKPTNPNTADQQAQRNKFKDAQQIVRKLGPTIYQSDWNRSVGQLPGFQSMNSVMLNQLDASLDLTLVNDIPLGNLHLPDSITLSSPVAGQLKIDWSTETASNGTASDIMVALIIAQDHTDRQGSADIIADVSAVRSDGTLSVNGFNSASTYEVYFYARGVGTASGLLSIAKADEELIS